MHEHGLRRMRDAGAVAVHAKGVYYEWVRTLEAARAFQAAHPELTDPPGFSLDPPDLPDTGRRAGTGRGQWESPVTDTADVIIIGAGVHGTSLAFHLAERGTSVIVLERAWIGAGATGRSSGLVRMHYDLLAETKLGLGVVPVLHDWAQRVGGECGFTNTGFLWLEHGEGEARVRANVDSHRALGIDTTLVQADDIARLAPAMALDGDEVAAYEPASGYADPSVSATGFMRAAKAMGARLVQGVEVTSITTSDDGTRVTGVGTTVGDVAAPIVVNAAGPWAAGVGAMVGLDVPVTVWRHDTGYIGVPVAAPRPIPVVIDNARSMYIRPEGGELLLIGSRTAASSAGHPTGTPRPPSPGSAMSSRTGSCAASRRSPTARSAPPTAARTA